MRCLTRTCQRDRPRWGHWSAFKGMGCRLCLGGRLQVIPCGIAAGPRLRKHPWMKGWPNVLSDAFQSKISCVLVTHYAQVGSFDGEPLTAMLGHACILVGLSVGYADRATVPPTYWFEDHGVETNRRRIPTIRHLQPRSPVYVPVDTRRPPQDFPVATTNPARPLALTCLQVCSPDYP